MEDFRDELGFLVWVEVEDEFVVDLEEHFGLVGLFAEEGVDLDHGEFDHVGGGALDGHVDGGALGVLAEAGVSGGEIRVVAAASGEGFGVASVAGLGDGAIHVLFDGGILAEVGVDDLCGFAAGDGEALAEAEGGDAVDDAEVDHFRAGAHVAGDFLGGDAVDFRGGDGVDVGAVLEGGDHGGIAGEGGHDAELDLGVIAGEEGEAFTRDEGLADFSASFGADGDILEIGV